MYRTQQSSHQIWLTAWLTLILTLPGCEGCSRAILPSKSAPDTSNTNSQTADATTPAMDSAPHDEPINPPPIQRDPRPTTDGDATASAQPDADATQESAASNTANTDEIGTSEPARGKKKPGDVNSTLKQINTLRQNAKQAKDGGDFGKAFQNVAKAWDAARMHPEDARCRALVEQLAAEIQELGPNANDRYRMRSAHSRLIVK